MELVRAIILKTVNYSETQKIIYVYSKEKGYLSFISPAFLFKRKKETVQLLQITEIEYFENDKGNLHKLKTVSPIVSTPALYFDIFKMNIVLLWGEILNLVLRHEGKNENLFDYIVQSVDYLNSTKADIGNFNLFFLYRLSAFIGFKINSESWQEGFIFSIGDGSFYPSSSGKPATSGPNTARIISQLCNCQVEELKNIPLNRESRNILLDIVLHYYCLHLNIDFNIRSIQVIREVFS